MKRIIYGVLLLLLSVFNNDVQASHYAGGYLTVQYVSGNIYQIKYVFYSDCNGISPSPSVGINISSVSCSYSFSKIISAISPSTIIPDGNCTYSTGSTPCSGVGFGLLETIYIDTVLIPLQCSDWIFSDAQCCRNMAINSTLSSTCYLEAKMNTILAPTNTLPDFIYEIEPQVCLGYLHFSKNKVIEPDGDSIVYSLAPMLDSTNSPVVYISPYTYSDFISSSTPIMINSNSGEVLFTPNQISLNVMEIKVSEYRNGQFIGSITREVEVFVTNGIYNPYNLEGVVYADLNQNQIRDTLEPVINGVTISSPTTGTLSISDSTGKYEIHLSGGNQTIQPVNLPLGVSINPASYNYNLTSTQQTISGNDFGIIPTSLNCDMRLSVVSGGFVMPGFVTTLYINAVNNGTDTVSPHVVVQFDSLLTYHSSSETPSLIQQNQIDWQFGTMYPLQQKNFTLQLNVDSFIGTNYPLSVNAAISGCAQDIELGNNVDSILLITHLSYDPNVKSVYPKYLREKDIQDGKSLNYTINFQNTGTAPATNVVVIDTLPATLNPLSIELLGADHPYSFSVVGTNILKWTFANINLADSSSNEPASHGTLVFKIKPYNTVQPGQLIINNAGIYFDLNAPVFTTDAIVPVYGTVSVEENNVSSKSNILVFPNPATDQLQLLFLHDKNEKVTLTIYNMRGELIRTTSQEVVYGVNKIDFSIADLNSGLYLLKLQSLKENDVVRFVRR